VHDMGIFRMRHRGNFSSSIRNYTVVAVERFT
jgi:hypothetical protein